MKVSVLLSSMTSLFCLSKNHLEVKLLFNRSEQQEVGDDEQQEELKQTNKQRRETIK